MAKWSVLACMITAALGLGAGLVIAGHGSSNADGGREPRHASRSTEEGSQGDSARPPSTDEPNADAPTPLDHARNGAARGAAPERDPGVSAPAASTPREAQLAREVEHLKKREAETRGELEASQRELDARDNLQKSFAPRQFDLQPDDWRALGREGTLKLRIPCPISPGDNLTKQQLDRLGLVPEDAPVITAAFQHSADRVWGAIGPLCAQVLGTTPELAAARGPNMCRRLILRDASQAGTALPAFQRVAAYLAGDAPAPSDASPVESMVLALAQEQGRLEQELAEYFGPVEADRLVFSDGLCFTEATHQLGAQKSASTQGASSAGEP